MIQSKLKYIIALFFIMLIPLTASAADFHVTTVQELQTALSTANSNGVDDTVYLAAGTYTGHFSYQPTESQAITIKAEDGLNPGQVVLDGGGSQILVVNGGANNADLTLERITLQNGSSTNGGGLNLTTAGDLIVTEVTCSGNQADVGAALYIGSVNTIHISNSNFSTNSGTGACTGVALFVGTANSVNLDSNSFVGNSGNGVTASLLRFGWYSTLNSIAFNNNRIDNNTIGSSRGVLYTGETNSITITGNTITNNIGTGGEWGSPLFIKPESNGTVLIENNIISNNSAKVYSFGYYELANLTNVNLTINNNVFSNNRATSYHGLMVTGNNSNSNNVTFTNNRVIDNSADKSYPALFIMADNLIMHNNIIAGNTSNNESFNGGGAYLDVSVQLNLINNTVSGNQCTSEGGGLYIYARDNVAINAYNNIIWGNTGNSGSDDLYLGGTGSNNKHLHYNDIHDMGGTLWDFVSNIIDVDPLFIDSGNDDYHLGATSLCLDVGLNTAPGIPATDLDGNARIANTTVDLGAYEHSTGDYHPADTNNDWVISSAEFTAYSDAWKTTASSIDIDYVTRAGYLLQNGSPAGTYKNIGGGKPLCWVPEP